MVILLACHTEVKPLSIPDITSGMTPHRLSSRVSCCLLTMDILLPYPSVG